MFRPEWSSDFLRCAGEVLRRSLHLVGQPYSDKIVRSKLFTMQQEVDHTIRSALDQQGVCHAMRHRREVSVGLGWQRRGNTSLKPHGDVMPAPGMIFHMTIHLFRGDEFMAATGDTVHVADSGPEALGSLSSDIKHL